MYKVITIPEADFWDENKEEFVHIPETKIKIIHSLVSISKWESKWHKAFLGKREKTPEEVLDYIKCMAITQNVPDIAYLALTNEVVNEVMAYLEDPMSASVIPEDDNDGKKNKDVLTSELLYYYMVANNIPLECEKWHLNRLINLIKICSIKNAEANGNNKVSRGDMARKYAKMNSKRRAAKHSKG